MCTVVVRIAPEEPFPLLLAANRDERLDRAWDPPGAWWKEQPGVVGGRDRSGGGTWMAVSAAGVVACVLNRLASLGPAPGKRSRGSLPLLALEASSAEGAAARIARVTPGDFRPFNMLLADRSGAFFQSWSGEGALLTERLAPGVHMIAARGADAAASPKVVRHLPRFRAARAPDPARNDWRDWRAILADTSGPVGSEITVPPRAGFGTVCAALLAIDRDGVATWQFAAGAPDHTPFAAVSRRSRSCAEPALASGDGGR